MIRKIVFGVIGITVILFFASLWVSRSDFDRACTAVNSLEQNEEYKKADPSLKGKMAYEVLNKVVWASPAAAALSAIMNAEPSQRYSLLKRAAEEVQGKAWSCPGFERFFLTQTPEAVEIKR